MFTPSVYGFDERTFPREKFFAGAFQEAAFQISAVVSSTKQTTE